MGKKKKKKKKEEFSVLNEIDKDILGQYADIKEDIEVFQYQLLEADKKTKRKYAKAIKKGKSFDLRNSDAVKARKKILKEMDDNNFLTKVLRMFEDLGPILRILGRCVSLLIVAILSIDSVKLSVNQQTMAKMDRIIAMGMSL